MFGDRIDSSVVSLYQDVEWSRVITTIRLKTCLWGNLSAKFCTPPVNLDMIMRRKNPP